MGFFSWECRGCEHSVRAPGAVNKKSAWMNEVVVLGSDGSRMMGCYDGYGRVERQNGSVTELDGNDTDALYHRTCWHLLGKPKFDKPSRPARDQGYFVGEYDPPEPTKVEDLEDLRFKVETDRAAQRRVQQGYEAIDKIMAEEVKPLCACGRDHHGISITRRMDGSLFLWCADYQCAKRIDLAPDIQTRLEAIYKEFGFGCLREDHPMLSRKVSAG